MSATLPQPLLPPTDNGNPTVTNTTADIEARLICIFDRTYDIQNNQDLQTEVAKLIYLRHVKQVFVDSDTTTTSTNFITKHVGTNPELAGAAKYTFGQIVTGQGLIREYLANPDPAIQNAIKLYVAPEYSSLQTILRNSTASIDLNKPNSVYILCPLGVIKQLIIVLQKMGFNKNYFRDGIHIQSNQLNSILANSIKKLIPDSNLNQSSGSGSSNGSNSSDESNDRIDSPPPTGRLRADSGLTSTIPQRQGQLISMIISSYSNTPTGTQLTLLAPDTTSPTTSNQALSILNFLSIKPDTKSNFKNMAHAEVSAKIAASDHNPDAIQMLGETVPNLYQENVATELVSVKNTLEDYKKYLKEYQSAYEKFEKEYKSGEKGRIYKTYIQGIFGEQEKGKNKNAEGFRIKELYYRLFKSLDNTIDKESLIKLIYETFFYENNEINSSLATTLQNLNYFFDLIKLFTYGGDSVPDSLMFDRYIHNQYTDMYNQNVKRIEDMKKFYDRTRDLTYVLEYINGYSYYKRNIYNLNHIIRYYNSQRINLKTRKTLKKGVPEQKPIQGAKYQEIENVPTLIKEKVNVQGANNLRAALKAQRQEKEHEKPRLAEPRKQGLKHLAGLTKKKYRQARQLSANIKEIDDKLAKMAPTPL